jgi:hypothetical protein
MFGIVFAQHSDNGDLTFLGWTTALAYVVGALFCVRAGIVTRHSDKQQPWWILAVILLFLGVNKLLNLQTRLINLGRSAAQTQGWYPYEREAQAVFVVLFTLVLAATLAACVKKWRRFVKEQPLALAGVLLLFLFVVVRAATLNHVDALLRLNLYDDYWAWTLELIAAACLAWSAAQVKAR